MKGLLLKCNWDTKSLGHQNTKQKFLFLITLVVYAESFNTEVTVLAPTNCANVIESKIIRIVLFVPSRLLLLLSTLTRSEISAFIT